jgi:uncharacterized membrane protein
MAEHTIFHSGDVFITPKLATFGFVTFQVSNITSVSLHEARKVSPVAIALGLIGAAAVVVAVGLYDRFGLDRVYIPGLVGLAALVLALMWQSVWPKMEYSFSLRLASGDHHTIVSNDRERSEQIRQALEQAFTLRA